MPNKNFFPLAASQLNLRRLLIIRAIIFCFQLLALLYANYFLHLSLNYLLIIGTLFALCFINLGIYLRLIKNWIVSDFEFLAHLLFDVFALAFLLYLSGGANNPFVSYFLVPVTIAAATLPWLYTWIVAGASVLSYSLLLFFYQPLAELMPMEMTMNMSMDNTRTDEWNVPSLHIIGMWFNFLVSAALITYFVVKMAEEIRSQAAKLSLYREENLRDEQILAVAIQAAGTAHELGTPLSSVAVILTEIEKDYPDNEELQKDIALIKQQVARCKTSLKELVTQADFRNAQSKKEILLLDFIQIILNQWQLLRPETPLHFKTLEKEGGPKIFEESTLQQTVINILNNAADASPAGIDVELSWDDKYWNLRIRDYGDGLMQDVAKQIGTNFVTTKEGGLGLGLVLSHASINRLGGSVSLHQHSNKGSITEIKLPFIQKAVV